MTRSDTPTADGAVSLDEQLDVLGHTSRRRLLLELSDRNPIERSDVGPLAPNGAERTRFEQELYHRHLPKLDSAKVVDWDRESATIRRGDRFDAIEPLVRLLDDHSEDLPEDWP